MTTVPTTAGLSTHLLVARPTRNFGSPDVLQIAKDSAVALLRPTLPALPAGAVVTEARLTYRQAGDAANSTAHSLQRVGRWAASKVTWDNPPPLVAGAAVSTVEKADTPDRTRWTHVVTADVVAWYGGAANYGWRLTSNRTQSRHLYGFTAARDNWRPVLEIDYIVAPAKATSLVPSYGAVSVDKPVLSWVGFNFTELRIQIATDPTVALDGSWVSPDFESGWVGASSTDLPLSIPAALGAGPVQASEVGTWYDLATTTFPGITPGQVWQVNLRNANGESGWAGPAALLYAPIEPPVLTDPGATSSDPTAPTAWECPEQAQRRVVTRDPITGAQFDDSRWSATTETAWTPAAGPTAPGPVEIELQVRDNVTREATPGAPDYASVVHTYDYVHTDTVPPAESLTVIDHPFLPVKILRWSRSELADFWVIERDGHIVRRRVVGGYQDAVHPGPELATGVGQYEWWDWSVSSYRTHTYQVRAMRNGETSAGGAPVTVTPSFTGTWLMDPDTGAWIVLAGADLQGLSYGESTTMHTPVGGSESIQVTHGLRGLEGTVSGVLDEADARPWVEQEADLWAMKRNPGRILRLVDKDLNIPVVVRDITPLAASETLPRDWRHGVSLAVAQKGELPWLTPSEWTV